MADRFINRKFYDALVEFETSEEAQDLYYSVMDSTTGKVLPNGHEETIREKILKVYGALFCEDTGLEPGQPAGIDDVVDTADRLYLDSPEFDPDHWYRMKYHFPVIDEDNYDRFASLVISDLNSGPLHEAASSEGRMLLVGEADPLSMTRQERENQQLKPVSLAEGSGL